MDFFEKYDFFCFQIFGNDVTFIFDYYFLNEQFAPRVPLTHYHEMWELYCITKGSIRLQTKNQVYDIGEKQFMFIPPYTEHCIISHEEGTVHLSIRIFISKDATGSQDIVNQLLNTRPFCPMNLSEVAISDLMRIQKYYVEYKQSERNNIWYVPKISSCSMHFFAELLSGLDCNSVSFHEEEKSYQKFFSPMLIEVLMEHESESKLSVSALAKNLNYSVEQMHRIVKQRFGKSFRTLLYEIRAKKAKAYLTQTELSINRIAEILGFKSTKNFNASFKSAEGVTPTEYRKLHSETKEV